MPACRPPPAWKRALTAGSAAAGQTKAAATTTVRPRPILPTEIVQSGCMKDDATGTPLRVLRIGVLALQGAFVEHVASLRRLEGELSRRGVHLEVQLVRCGAEVRGEQAIGYEVKDVPRVAALDGLIIPGGESTAMRRLLTCSTDGLLDSLRDFIAAGRPVFGTCAGCILLADKQETDSRMELGPVAESNAAAASAQAVLGGIDMAVARNYYGAQLHSFHTNDVQLHDERLMTTGQQDGSGPASPPGAEALSGSCPGVFIRAPAIVAVGPGVQVLASLPHADGYRCPGTAASVMPPRSEAVVAVRSGAMLATCFHPELTDDLRWHRYFVGMALERTGADI